MSTNDIEYYKNYYNNINVYKGEDWKGTSRMLVFQDWLKKALKPGAKVLDIGCGDAIFAELMPEFEWYGVDINTEKANGRIKEGWLISHDLMQTPYPLVTGYFDAVVCSEVLEHLWDLRIVHKEAKRLLKRDGTYIISTPNHDWIQNQLECYRRDLSNFEQPWTIEHIRHYNYTTHKKFLNEVGFIVNKHTGADGHFDPITASICHAIHEGLNNHNPDSAKLSISRELLHKWAGEGISYQSHTIILEAKKA